MENSRFKDKTYIGSGGTALFYKAYDQTACREVFIKELDQHLRDNQKVRDMFLDEARKMARVEDCPNVVCVYEILDEEVPTIIMELAGASPNLTTRLGVGGLPTSEVVCILEHVIAGLKKIHDAGMIHRDIKPENILEHNGIYKITGFGVATSGEEDTLPFVNSKYAAPEALNDPSKIRANSDIYSLGMMATELLLGSRRFEEMVIEALESEKLQLQHQAFQGGAQILWQRWVCGNANLPPLHTLDDAISPELSAFLVRLTNRDLHTRPQDCDALKEDLNTVKRIEGLRLIEPDTSTIAPPLKEKQPLWFKLTLSMGILLLLGVAILLMVPTRFHMDLVTNPPGATVTVNGQLLEDDPTPTWFKGKWGDTVVLQMQGGEPVGVVLAQDMEGLTQTEDGWKIEIGLGNTVAGETTIMNSSEAAQYLRTHLSETNPLTVSLDGFVLKDDGYSVKVGTSLNYQIQSNRPGYLIALHLGSNDVLTVIYPSPVGGTPVLTSQGTASVGHELNLAATEPLGTDRMVFVVVDKLPTLPVIHGAQAAGAWGLRFPFGGENSPGRDLILWLQELVTSTKASSAIVQIEIVNKLSEP